MVRHLFRYFPASDFQHEKGKRKTRPTGCKAHIDTTNVGARFYVLVFVLDHVSNVYRFIEFRLSEVRFALRSVCV